MNNQYDEGCSARRHGRPYASPYSRTTKAHINWCAGWNDTDMMRYFVNDKTRMVRTDDTGKYEPTGDWRQVTLEEWTAFRKASKKK